MRKDIKDFYKKLGHAWCPTLNDHIAFTSAGLRHLIWKNKKARPRRDQERRVTLLPYVKEIIEDPASHMAYRENHSIQFRKNHNEAIPEKRRARFWTLSKTYGERTITVVIRQIGTKEKHFFSVYDK